ncbi:DUF7691 family protein [Actinomadura miaoliensis]|uniref:DUF7691 domain-containing protein n=1 Tax=Actinomadura miaoliensis TaxID=430685 RepID=A0ABP7W1W0_9ACTN
MSYAIMPYAVPLNELQAMIGSRDTALLDRLRSQWSSHLASLDELREDTGLDGDDVPSAERALEQMIMGEPYDDRIGFLYGYCLKILCGYAGWSLPNEGWWGMRFSWFETVAGELKNAGVDFDPTDLIFGGAPISLPFIGDFPNIGHLKRAEMIPLLARFDGLNEDAVTDREALEAILQIRDWLRQCVAAERDLVCFYH